MPEKLMTVKELAEYLKIGEEKIIDLVEKRVISAYKIGGELLRFRREQIDAIRAEIYSRLDEGSKGAVLAPQKSSKERLKVYAGSEIEESFRESFADFFYFSDFYIVSGVIVVLLLLVIFRG